MIRLMRHDAGDVHWNWGYLLSVPVAWLLVHGQLDGDPARAQYTAMLAVLLALPWIVPAFIVVAVLSAPLYVWLHTLGPAPEVDVLARRHGARRRRHRLPHQCRAGWRRDYAARRQRRESGLGEFLRRPRNGAAH